MVILLFVSSEFSFRTVSFLLPAVYFSPVLGEIEMDKIVEFMKDKKLNDVRLQVQLHKIIWHKDARGV